MSNDPKAGPGIDAALLAAYLDQRLSPEQRAAVEAQLASDPESYELLVEVMSVQEHIAGDLARERVSPQPVLLPFKPASRRWPIVSGILAVAAAAALVLWTQPDIMRVLSGNKDSKLATLFAAVGNQRVIEGRITGGLEYAPFRSSSRGGESEANVRLLAAAAELHKAASELPNAENLHASGIGFLLTGRLDDAIDALEDANTLTENARYRADLSAAYVGRAQHSGSADDWARGLKAAEHALKMDPNLPEALFNRAVTLTGLERTEEAAAAWSRYLELDETSGWADEARQRLGAR
jgi:tetratricopeptide (TPR) repeat protein